MNTVKSQMTLILLTSALALLSACDSSSSPSKDNHTLSYEFESNGCNTGSHTFNSLAAYCDGLRNDELNKGCAYDLRANAYANRCEQQQGETKPRPDQSRPDQIFTTLRALHITPSSYTQSATITGILSIDSFSNDLAEMYDLRTASGMTAENEDGNCRVEAIFEQAKVRGNVAFTVLVHQAATSPYSCVEIVEKSLRQGSSISPTNVKVRYKDGTYDVKDKVVLYISAMN